MKRILLASGSPRRKELLTQMGCVFEVCKSEAEEVITSTNPEEVVMELSSQKGEDVFSKTTGDVCVIGADTVVAVDGNILGKPADEEDIYRMLRMLSGDVHEVVTAYAIYQGNKELVHRICTAEIYIEKMADAEIQAYIDTGSPFDKAGAYGIQDKDCIECKILKGDYYTVVGLPRDDLEDDLFQLHIID